ncbi:hypothetical protein WQ54_12845 [Bacillus sp. SA1-12]|uniref:hypothetical protein n=1 Tax=Bacillus sp. SA1-12 TaxID=1455638 RepID=UPI000626740A|nr:hypothetical protein [Bacillus sp. SA1-12]KKI91851.1 hypothetical protein WQ54_12845 [Bacillus sp. SA1-12]
MKVPIPDEQEELIHNYILHTYLLNILESDLKTITKACFKIHEPYIKLVEETLKKIRIEVRGMKGELRKIQMKLEEPFLEMYIFGSVIITFGDIMDLNDIGNQHKRCIRQNC